MDRERLWCRATRVAFGTGIVAAVISVVSSGVLAQSVEPPAIDAIACGESAEVSGKRAVRVCRAIGELEIDGVREEAAWSAAARVDLPFETYPGDNARAPVATACYVTFDERDLFVACDAADPDPAGIRAFYTPRDESSGQDRIGFLLDPFNDARRAFEFIVTPLGVQADGVFDQQDGSVDASWDAIWKSAGHITDSGYSVEVAIPFKSLRFPNTENLQSWGFYIWRTRPRSDNLETRSVPFDRGNGCLLCQAELLTGLRDIAPGRNVQLTPTLTGSRSDVRIAFPSGALETGTPGVRAGADAQWSPSPNVSLAATVNPDFSQVEADVAQLDVNNRFTLFFPEKRPFFLEGAEFYSTPFRTVFTRTISNPVFGARLSGKMGGTAVGAIVAGDRVNNLLLPANQGSSMASVDSRVVSTIARARRDIGSSSTIGLLYTGREGPGYHNRVLGVDGFVQPWSPLTLRFHVLHSHTDYVDEFAHEQQQPAGGFAGDGALVQANYESRTLRGQAQGRIVDSGFRADAGFVEQVDVREVNVWGQRQFWGGRGRWLERLNLTAGHWTKWRSDGLVTEQVFWGNVLYLGPRLLRVFLDYQRRREYYAGAVYWLNRYRAEVGFAPSGVLSASVAGRTGDAIDLANTRSARQDQLSVALRLRIGRHADLDLQHAFERLRSGGVPVVTAQLSQLRAVYNLSARTYVRAIVQYRFTDRNPAAYVDPVEESAQSLFSQLLFAYEANPQTLVFLGYSDGRDGVTEADGSVIPLTLASRTFFVKLSYAWRP